MEAQEEVDLKAAVEAGTPIKGEPEVNDVEITWTEDEAEEAEAMGWIPPERAKKLPEGKKFAGPKEFMERNPLYKKVKQLETSIGQLNEHHSRVSETERKKLTKEYEAKITSLQEERIKALDEGDNRKAVEIESEIRTTEKPEEVKPETDPIFQNWVNENEWYEKDAFLRVEATKVGEILYSDKLYGRELLDAVKAHLKEAHPDKFENPNRAKPAAVEASSQASTPKSTGKVSVKDLTADERTVYTNFERMKVFKTDDEKQKYLKEVIELRD